MNPNEIKAKRIEGNNNIRIIVAGRSSYCYVFNPVADDNEKPEGTKSYKTAILVPKDCPTEVKAILNQAVKDAIALGIKTKWGGTRPAELDLPIKDGDKKAAENEEKYGAYRGNFHFTAKRQEDKGRPRLKAYGAPVDKTGIIESGDWCVFDVAFYPFNKKNKGVAVALNGVTLIKEGERFAGGPSADSIDNEANDLYGELLAKPMSNDDADDLMSTLGGSSNSADDLMDLLK